jgi:hypothetical protein
VSNEGAPAASVVWNVSSTARWNSENADVSTIGTAGQLTSRDSMMSPGRYRARSWGQLSKSGSSVGAGLDRTPEYCQFR